MQRAEIDRRVCRRAAARVVAQIVADHRFVEALHAVVERGGRRHLLAAPQGELVAFVGVVIGEDLRLVAIEHEQVAVPAEGEARAGLLAERLLHAGEPGLGVFPRIEIAVELVGAEWVVHVGQVDGAVADAGGDAGHAARTAGCGSRGRRGNRWRNRARRKAARRVSSRRG